MNSDDKKIKMIMEQALKELVVPKLDKIEKKQKEHDEQFVRVNGTLDATMEMVAQNSEDITVMQENVKDIGFTQERIETKLDASVRRQDDVSIKYDQLNRRVLRLATKKD